MLTKTDTVLSFKACTSNTSHKQTRSRLFVSVEGESIFENLENRFDRPVAEYKRLLRPIFKMLGVEKPRWSQKAGCSCGCSPGFVLDRKIHLGPEGIRSAPWRQGHDIHVTISGAPKNDGHPRELL